uniref:Uncharacterized protein n=1 Tax=Rhodnius prolixus TaxID=13249 RepID=T1HDX6_RHOPR
MRVVLLFCRLYNCTIQIVYDDGLWGTIQGNGSGDGRNHNEIGRELEGIKDITLMVLGMYVQQAPSKNLGDNHVSINKIVTSVAILCVLLTSCYSAGLPSHLTVPQ